MIFFLVSILFDQRLFLFRFFFRRFFSLLFSFFRFLLCFFPGFLFGFCFGLSSPVQPVMAIAQSTINTAISTAVIFVSFRFVFMANSLSGSLSVPADPLNTVRFFIKRKSYSASASLRNNSLTAYHSLIVTTVPTFTNFLISSMSLFRTRILPAEEALPRPSGLFVPEIPIPFHSPLLSSRVSRVMNQGP